MKDIDEARHRVGGLFNITTTPFGSDGVLLPGALHDQIGRVVDTGFDGLLIGGTYGEFATMTLEERLELLKLASEYANDRVPIMFCVAHSDMRVVKELTIAASVMGALPMVTAPYVSEVTDDQIAAFFETIGPLSKTGILIYNAPGIGITLSVPLIERIADQPGIVGLKQGELSPRTVDSLLGRLSGKISLFCASDLSFIGPIASGFDGLSSTNSSALPEIIHASYEALINGNVTEAADLHRSWYPLRNAISRYGQPQTTKAVMNARGFEGGHVRPPLLDLSGDALAEVERLTEELRLDMAGELV